MVLTIISLKPSFSVVKSNLIKFSFSFVFLAQLNLLDCALQYSRHSAERERPWENGSLSTQHHNLPTHDDKFLKRNVLPHATPVALQMSELWAPAANEKLRHSVVVSNLPDIFSKKCEK